jgi:hypothetical protein
MPTFFKKQRVIRGRPVFGRGIIRYEISIKKDKKE